MSQTLSGLQPTRDYTTRHSVTEGMSQNLSGPSAAVVSTVEVKNLPRRARLSTSEEDDNFQLAVVSGPANEKDDDNGDESSVLSLSASRSA